ncbi:MAG TPA: type III secretion system chaperone [Ramlibacter sp.]|nr:type III secretion system chaperone [Ramlibacter sp.]
MQNLAQSLGMQTLKLSSTNSCAFDFAEDKIHAELRYVEQAGVFNLCMGVSTATGPRRAELIRTLLLANISLSDLNGSHFALRGVEEEVVLCRTIDAATLGETGLVNAVEQSVVATRACRLRLQNI